MSELVSRSVIFKQVDSVIPSDYLQHRHRLNHNRPIIYSCKWLEDKTEIHYSLEVGQKSREYGYRTYCKEFLKLIHDKTNYLEFISSDKTDYIDLYENLKNNDKAKNYLGHIRKFFMSLCYLYYFNFQSTSLGQHDLQTLNKFRAKKKTDLNIPYALGVQGENFQSVLTFVKQNYDSVMSRFQQLMQQLNTGFKSIYITKRDTSIRWQFEGLRSSSSKTELMNFKPFEVSDGILKCGAIALLVSLPKPVSLLMFEELENGIHEKNLREVMRWLTDEKPKRTQIIMSSHNPTALMNFQNKLEFVNYFIWEKDGHQSNIQNFEDLVHSFVLLKEIDGTIKRVKNKNKITLTEKGIFDFFYIIMRRKDNFL